MARDIEWEREFGQRMRRFARIRPAAAGQVLISIKVRVTAGCFHREDSAQAYKLIDRQLAKMELDEVGLEEHESGPELLVWISIASAAASIVASIVSIIATIIKARSEGIKKGDRPSEPLELIIRRIDEGESIKEELVLRIGHDEKLDEKMLEQKISKGLRRIVKK